MTDNEIIKALECCQTQYARKCKDCPYERYQTHYISTTTCSSDMRKDLLDLINRQRAEIEKLKTEIGNQSILWSKHFESIFETAKEDLKAEAIKEFAEELEVRWWESGYGELSNRVSTVVPALIHRLLEEKVGEAE